jgi:hypothetical protein
MRADRGFGRRALLWGAPAAAWLFASPAVAAAPVKESPAPAAPAEHKKPSDFIVFEAETGAQYIGLGTLHVKRDVVPTASRKEDVGMFFGAGAAVKIVFLSLGPHFRMGHFQDWDLWTLDLDLGFHAPLGAFEPFLRLSGGYASLARAFDRLQDNRNLRAWGYHVALTLGADYFATDSLTIGARLSGDMLALQRAGVDLNAQDGLVNDYLKYDGAAAGLGLTTALALGLHF